MRNNEMGVYESILDLKLKILLLLKEIEFSNFPKYLPGRNSIRGNMEDLNGYYCNNLEEGVDIIGKDGLTLTLSLASDEGEWDSTWDNYYELYLKENDLEEDEDWDGVFEFELNEETGLMLLLHLSCVSL